MSAAMEVASPDGVRAPLRGAQRRPERAERICKVAQLTDALVEAGCADGAVLVAAVAGCDAKTCWLIEDAPPSCLEQAVVAYAVSL